LHFIPYRKRVHCLVKSFSREQSKSLRYASESFCEPSRLVYPKHHDERAPPSVKTRNNRMFFRDSLLSNKSRVTAPQTTPSVVVCLFCERVYNQLTNPTILRQHHCLLSPAISAHNVHRKSSCMSLLLLNVYFIDTHFSRRPFNFGMTSSGL
jgi:hypothetical protein